MRRCAACPTRGGRAVVRHVARPDRGGRPSRVVIHSGQMAPGHSPSLTAQMHVQTPDARLRGQIVPTTSWPPSPALGHRPHLPHPNSSLPNFPAARRSSRSPPAATRTPPPVPSLLPASLLPPPPPRTPRGVPLGARARLASPWPFAPWLIAPRTQPTNPPARIQRRTTPGRRKLHRVHTHARPSDARTPAYARTHVRTPDACHSRNLGRPRWPARGLRLNPILLPQPAGGPHEHAESGVRVPTARIMDGLLNSASAGPAQQH